MPRLVGELKDFRGHFSKNFWEQINEQYLDILERQTSSSIVEGVYNSLLNQNYYPSKPKYYIDKNKGNGVLRRIPVLEPRDYAVYFYCLKILEVNLSINRVPNTYGGWSLGGLIRISEENELKPLEGTIEFDWLNDSSIPSFSYNKYAWVLYYGDYQGKLYAHLKELVSKSETKSWIAVQFDIENFYDSVRLNILEKNIRGLCTKKQIPIIDLLVHFLKYWNRDVNGYDSQQTGIPQDALSDCSRILANFYLQDYDRQIYQYTQSQNSHFFRYSDDQIIITKDTKSAETALHKASLELAKIGLNINKAKVTYFTLEELIEHFSFLDFKLLTENKNDPNTLEAVVSRYLKSTNATKKSSLLNKILGQDLSLLRRDLRTRILADAFDKDFITIYSRANVLKRIYDNLGHDERTDFIAYLDSLCDEIEFSGFQFELLNFYRKINKDTTQVITRIKHLNKVWV